MYVCMYVCIYVCMCMYTLCINILYIYIELRRIPNLRLTCSARCILYYILYSTYCIRYIILYIICVYIVLNIFNIYYTIHISILYTYTDIYMFIEREREKEKGRRLGGVCGIALLRRDSDYLLYLYKSTNTDAPDFEPQAHLPKARLLLIKNRL